MQIFVWEYCCATPWLNHPASLLREGQVMLSAVAADFAGCAGVEVRTVSPPLSASAELAAFDELCRGCAWSLLIAPESDGILFDRCRMVEKAGGRLLGPDAAAARLTGDKWELSRHLLRHGVPTPRCELLSSDAVPSLSFPLVWKPRYGAGSQATFLVRTQEDFERAMCDAHAEGFVGEPIVQPFVPGRPVSVAFLIGSNGRLALPATEQYLSADGRFRYRGGRAPLPEPWNTRAQTLAARAVACVPGLRGYVGVDLILGETAAEDMVIEINPRLTTSYVGLRLLTVDNLAAAMLAVALGDKPPALEWRAEAITFTV